MIISIIPIWEFFAGVLLELVWTCPATCFTPFRVRALTRTLSQYIGDNSCELIQVHSEMSGNLDVWMNGRSAFQEGFLNITFYDPSSNANIYCSGIYACGYCTVFSWPCGTDTDHVRWFRWLAVLCIEIHRCVTWRWFSSVPFCAVWPGRIWLKKSSDRAKKVRFPYKTQLTVRAHTCVFIKRKSAMFPEIFYHMDSWKPRSKSSISIKYHHYNEIPSTGNVSLTCINGRGVCSDMAIQVLGPGFFDLQVMFLFNLPGKNSLIIFISSVYILNFI